jgi:hypothetical protein
MYIHSFGHFHPENIIDNCFLEHLDIGTDDEWIIARTGIRTRHTVLPLDYICASSYALDSCTPIGSIRDHGGLSSQSGRIPCSPASHPV